MDELKSKLLFYISPRLKKRDSVRKRGKYMDFKDESGFIDASFDHYPLSWRLVSPSRRINKQNLKRILERNLYCHSHFIPNLEGRSGRALQKGISKKEENEDNAKSKTFWGKSLINQSTPLGIIKKTKNEKLISKKYPTYRKILFQTIEEKYKIKPRNLIKNIRYIKDEDFLTLEHTLSKSLSKFQPKGASYSQFINAKNVLEKNTFDSSSRFQGSSLNNNLQGSSLLEEIKTLKYEKSTNSSIGINTKNDLKNFQIETERGKIHKLKNNFNKFQINDIIKKLKNGMMAMNNIKFQYRNIHKASKVLSKTLQVIAHPDFRESKISIKWNYLGQINYFIKIF